LGISRFKGTTVKLVDRMILEIIIANSTDGLATEVTHRQIADELGVSRRTVVSGIHWLCKNGLLKSQQHGLNRPNSYEIQSGSAKLQSGCAILSHISTVSFKSILKENCTTKGFLGDKILDNGTPEPQSANGTNQGGSENVALPARTGSASLSLPAQTKLIATPQTISHLSLKFKTTVDFVKEVVSTINGEFSCGIGIPPQDFKNRKSEETYHYRILESRIPKALANKKEDRVDTIETMRDAW
jgi:hypothetical protein